MILCIGAAPCRDKRRDRASANGSPESFVDGLERCDVQAPCDKAARQLAAAAPDLEHMITAPDPCDLTSLIDEFVRIRGTAAVVLSRDSIKNSAVTTCGEF